MKKFNSSKKKWLVAKRAVLFAMLILCCMGSVFASNDAKDNNNAAKGINDTVANILGLFESGWVKGVLCLALIGECLGLIMGGGQNPQVLKKFLPIIAGTILFMCAGKIANLVMGGQTTGTFGKDLNMSGYVIERVETDILC